MAVRILHESTKVKDAYEILSSAGFSKNKVSPIMGNTIKDDEISASKEFADGELEAIIEFDKNYFDKPGFVLAIVGDDVDDMYLQNTEQWSLKTCIKIAKLAEKYFDDNPVTPKFAKRFADSYDMQVY